MHDLTRIETMLLGTLIAEQERAVAPVRERINEAVAEVCAARGIPVAHCRLDLESGTVTDARELMETEPAEPEPLAAD